MRWTCQWFAIWIKKTSRILNLRHQWLVLSHMLRTWFLLIEKHSTRRRLIRNRYSQSQPGRSISLIYLKDAGRWLQLLTSKLWESSEELIINAHTVISWLKMRTFSDIWACMQPAFIHLRHSTSSLNAKVRKPSSCNTVLCLAVICNSTIRNRNRTIEMNSDFICCECILQKSSNSITSASLFWKTIKGSPWENLEDNSFRSKELKSTMKCLRKFGTIYLRNSYQFWISLHSRSKTKP